MSQDPHHFHPEVVQLLVEAIPRLCRTKADLLAFFQGAGCDEAVLEPHRALYRENRDAFRKPIVCREILLDLNEQGDLALRARREIVKRVCQFEDFSTCWPNDVQQAKGYVADLRRIVNIKDSFTRMKDERERERAENVRRYEEQADAKRRHEAQLKGFEKTLADLTMMTDPAKRGKALEGLLNDWFRAVGVGIQEAFTVRVEGAGVIEQIDGLVKMEGHLYLVEMKWRTDPIGVDQVGPHFVRVYHREARGILISASGFTAPAVEITKNNLSLKTFVLCELSELVLLLGRRGDLKRYLVQKADAAIAESNPLFKPSI